MGTGIITKQWSGKRLNIEEKLSLTDQIVEYLEEGYHSISELARMCQVNRTTIRRYLPFALKRYHGVKLNRGSIRTLELQRAYRLRERLTDELDGCQTIKEKVSITNQINNVSKHIAFISGIGAEAKTVTYNDVKQLVITRANPAEVSKIKQEAIEAGFEQ